jgi:hypothetical protein
MLPERENMAIGGPLKVKKRPDPVGIDNRRLALPFKRQRKVIAVKRGTPGQVIAYGILYYR